MGLKDTFVPDFETSPEYDELVTLRGESDYGDTDSDASDEDDQERDIALLGDRKFPYKRTSCAAVGCFDDLEVEEAIKFDATIRASIRYPVNGGAWTSASSTIGHIRAPPAPAAAVQCFVMKHGFEVDSDVDPDSGFEGEVMMLTSHGKDRCRDNSQQPTAYDVGSSSSCYEGREDHRPDRLDKPQRTMSEDALGRQVTHVGQADGFPVPRFVCS